MLQDIKIIIEELIFNIQMEFFCVFWQYDALSYWEVKEIGKQEPYNKEEQDEKTNKNEKLLLRQHQT